MKLPNQFFPEQKKIEKPENQSMGPPMTPTSPLAATRGPAPLWLVGSLGHLSPRTFAYKFPKILEKIRRSS